MKKQLTRRQKQYADYAKGRSAPSPLIKDCLRAFLCGGSICCLAQALTNLYLFFGLEKDNARTCVSLTLIALTVLLTGLGVFDRIAKFAGAGTLVPITGFANAVAAAAIDNKTEGLVLGVGAKIFTIAGPVILYGTFASAVYGVICYLVSLFTQGAI